MGGIRSMHLGNEEIPTSFLLETLKEPTVSILGLYRYCIK